MASNHPDEAVFHFPGFAVTAAPKPPQRLGKVGREVWQRVWSREVSWLDPLLDRDAVWTYAALHDERAELTAEAADDWRARVALRRVDTQIERWADRLGLTPRGRRLVKEAPPQGVGKLAQLREARRRWDAG